MSLSIAQLLQNIRNNPDAIEFPQVIETINTHYNYAATTFSNGVDDDCVVNNAGTNEGSCRVFAFAQLNQLNDIETLSCFGQFYRAVLATPNGSDHPNIRTFMRHGWKGIRFEGAALSPK